MSEARNKATGRPAFGKQAPEPEPDADLAPLLDGRPIRLSVDLPPPVAIELEKLVMRLKQSGHRKASKAGLVRVMIDRLLADEEFRAQTLNAARRQL